MRPPLLLLSVLLSAAVTAGDPPALPATSFAWWQRPPEAGDNGDIGLLFKRRAWYGVGEAAVLRGGWAQPARESAAAIAAQAAATGVVVVAAWLAPAGEAGTAWSLTTAGDAPLAALAQAAGRWQLRAGAGAIDLGAIAAGGEDVVVALAAGEPALAVWRGGRPLPIAVPPPPIAVTTATGLRFGAAADGSGAWHGVLARVAVAHQRPQAGDLAARTAAIAAAAQPPPQRIVVDGVLEDRATKIDPDYPRVLLGHRYRVVKVLSGEYGKTHLQVFHWGALGFTPVREVVERTVGATYRVQAVPWAAVPSLAGTNQSQFSSYDADLPDWFDPGF